MLLPILTLIAQESRLAKAFIGHNETRQYLRKKMDDPPNMVQRVNLK